MFVNWKLDLYSYDDTVGSHSTTITSTLTNFFSPRVRTKLGEGKDTFEFKVQNNRGEFDNFFQPGDKVVVSRGVNKSTLDSSDIIMNSVIKKAPFKKQKKNTVKIGCNNFSETLMNAITFVDGSELTIPEFIEAALNAVNANNPAFGVTWKSTNPSLKSDGSAFPNGERWYNKSVLKLLETYSNGSYTDDGNYFWYVNIDNELVWDKETQSVSETFDSDKDNYILLDSKKDTSEVINFIIIKGDTSPSGKVIQTRVDDAVSRVKNGFKPKIITSKAQYARELIELDRSANPSDFDEGDTNPNTYPFTTFWKASVARPSNPTMVVGSQVTVSDKKEYNRAVQSQVVFELKKEANRFLNERGSGKVQVEITFQPGKTPNGQQWSIGNVISVTIPELGKSNDPMRVEEADYTETSESYTLIEDEGTV